MAERALNVFWVLLGAGAVVHSWQVGLVGSMGPDSGLFPLIAGLIVAGTGLALLLAPSTAAPAPAWPRGAALGRVLGVVAGLAVMALGVGYLGFAVAAALTMLVLLHTIERASWASSIVLALGSVAVVMWVFGGVLGMPLPRGPWGW
jgi:putative tricarboxylic transport membrane protein